MWHQKNGVDNKVYNKNLVLVCKTTMLQVYSWHIYNDDAPQCAYNNNAQCMYSELQACLIFV